MKITPMLLLQVLLIGPIDHPIRDTVSTLAVKRIRLIRLPATELTFIRFVYDVNRIFSLSLHNRIFKSNIKSRAYARQGWT
ncbi:hypothetical protein PAECIP112173_01220 [Paenibacillus sp. JJ-100]|uniref:hypothetical protein n=1 Tax=Paenibacillus sp. JJ-100 TaxID=2974896 RepID=UPI0022FF5C99|nr:hypothetical protein [Paenibacillus sp. JJ-100]CAI6046580.1 hypothetical protein PAECIP112173_01220 [Paenibacillus sp. JJ-100]